MNIVTNTVNKILTRKKSDPGAGWEMAAKTLVCLAFFLTPMFVGWWTTDIWESHKMLLLLAAVSGGWLCFWIAVLRRRTVTWYWHRIDLFVAAIVVVTGLSTLTSINPWQAFVPLSSGYAETVPGIVVLAALYLLTIQLFRQRHDQVMGWTSLATGLVVVSLMQLWQLSDFSLWPPALPRYPFFSPINGSAEGLTVIAALVSSAALLGWTMAKELWHRLLIIAGVAAGWLILVVSGQAIGWAVFALGMIIVMLSQARQGTNAHTRLIGFAVGLAALGMVIQFSNLANHSSLSPAHDPKLDTTTSAAITWSTLVNHMPFGSGPGTWYYDFVAFRPASFNMTPYWNIRFAQAGNQWWQTLATTGVFGLVAWLAVVIAAGTIAWRRWQKNGDWASAISVLLAATLILVGFFTTWSLTLLVLFFGSFGLVRATTGSSAKAEPLTIRTGLGFAATLVLALLWWYPAGRIYASDIITRQAVKAINRVEPIIQVEARLQRAVTLNWHNLDAAALLANAYLVELQVSLQSNGDVSQNQAISKKIAQQLLFMQNADPRNPVGYEISNNILSTLAGVIGDVEVEAQKNFQALRRLEPTNPIHDVGYGQALMVSRTRILAAASVSAEQAEEAEQIRTQAIAAYNQALRKKPDYLQAQLSRVQALSAGGQNDLALEEMTAVLGQNSQVGILWAQQAHILSLLDRGEEAVASFEQALQLESADPSIYLTFADHYSRAKDTAKVKEVLERGLQALPGDTQLQSALDSLQ